MKIALGFEILSYVIIPVVPWLFWRFARRNVIGDMIAGAMIGAFNEFATEPLWDYHFRWTIYKDVPLSVVLGWGMMFAIIVFLSEKIYCKALKQAAVRPYDKRIFISDLLAGVAVGLTFEVTGYKAGVWSYNTAVLDWTWGTIPFVNLPVEALVGYSLLTLIGPTFVRYWQGAFEGAR
jgi:hypothetical protein